MMKLLLGLADVPAPHDAADALAVAVCHLNSSTGVIAERAAAEKTSGRAATSASRGELPAGAGAGLVRRGRIPAPLSGTTRRRGAASAKK